MKNCAPIDIEFADFVNRHLAGKTILRAEPVATGCPVNEVLLICTDGSKFRIQGEHDEGFVCIQDKEEEGTTIQ